MTPPWLLKLDDILEEIRVRWLLMDAQKRQVVLLAALYAGYTLLDVVGAFAKAKAAAKGGNPSG